MQSPKPARRLPFKYLTGNRLTGQRLIGLLAVAGSLWLATPACVTVNVNFPEASVQQATDDYVQDLYKAKEKGKPSPTPSAKPGAAAKSVGVVAPGLPGSLSGALVDWLIVSAEAADLKIRVDSAKALEIRDRQVARLDQIHAAKAAGKLGETNDGKLQADPGNQLKPADKKAMTALAEAENQDRKQLYEEVLAANGYAASRLIDIEKSFARSFQAHSEAGTWLQDEAGKWTRKP